MNVVLDPEDEPRGSSVLRSLFMLLLLTLLIVGVLAVGLAATF